MKTLKFKRGFAVMLIFIMLISTTGCFNGSETNLNSTKADLSNSEVESSGSEQESSGLENELNSEKKIDVILWNEKGLKYYSEKASYLMREAATQFENKTGTKVNLISIDADTQDEYFEKRLEYLNSEDQPEMILFSTFKKNDLLVMDSMKNELLHTEDYVENINDVFEGMKEDRYCAIATIEVSPVLMNKGIDKIGYEPNGVVMKSEEVDALFLKWAEVTGGVFNLFDYLNISKLGLGSTIQIKDKEVKLDQEAIISKIRRNEAFVKSYPKRNLSVDDVKGVFSGENEERFNNELDLSLKVEFSKPVNFITHMAFNAFDMLDFSNRMNEVFSGFWISDDNFTEAIGFGILDNQSKEQADAIDFANFLLSHEFQMKLRTYTSISPRVSGPVLKSIVKNEIESARSQELLQNGQPIKNSIIEVQEILSERYDQPGYLQSSAKSSVVNMATEEIFNLSNEQIWGVAKTDEELRAELSGLEERLNLMINK